jgi:hypothetical protein
MARTRSRTRRYGGDSCGVKNGATSVVTPITGLHTCVDSTHPGPPYRTGGPLSISKKRVLYGRTAVIHSDQRAGALHFTYDGYLYAQAYVPPSAPSATPLATVDAYGAKGWNRTFPVHPIYQLGVSLIELRDLPRMLLQTWKFLKTIQAMPLTRIPKTIGEFLSDVRNGTLQSSGHYLNLQFGWVPFIQDLVFITKMKAKLRKKMAWLKKQNGKSTKSVVILDKSDTTVDVPRSSDSVRNLLPPLDTYLYVGYSLGPFSNPIQKRSKRKIWYEAKYRFWIPEITGKQVDSWSYIQLEAELLGLSLDPSILYKVYPWSWLLDWFTSVGTVVQNITMRSRHQVVAEYAYVMCSEDYTYYAPSVATVHTGNSISIGSSWSGPDLTLSALTSVEYQFRTRRVANPYGFGIIDSSLSAYQWSILAALGLSHRG